MNPVLHHFRKKIRWLRPRWVVFLILLGFDLALSLGWWCRCRLMESTACVK